MAAAHGEQPWRAPSVTRGWKEENTPVDRGRCKAHGPDGGIGGKGSGGFGNGAAYFKERKKETGHRGYRVGKRQMG